MKYLNGSDCPIVKDFYLSRIPAMHTAITAEAMAGLAPYLIEKDITNWLDPYVKALVSNLDITIKTEVESSLALSQFHLSQECAAAVDRRLNDWLQYFNNKKQTDLMSVIEKLKANLESHRNITF